MLSLLFNMLSRLVIAFLPRSKHLNFMATVTICSDFGAQENKVFHCFQCFPIYLSWSDGTLQLNFQRTKIMASSPISSWQIDEETIETVTNFILGAPKSLQMVTAAMKLRHLLLGRKVMTNLDRILKSKDITLPTKVHLVKAMVFPVVMYRRESWTTKKPEHQRIDAFELWCWRRLLRFPWTARRSSQY